MCVMEENLTPQESLQSDAVAAEAPAEQLADQSVETDVEPTAEVTIDEPAAPGRFRSMPWKTIGALTLTTAFGVTGVALLANADGADHARPLQAVVDAQQGQFGQQGVFGAFGDQQGQFGGRQIGRAHV